MVRTPLLLFSLRQRGQGHPLQYYDILKRFIWRDQAFFIFDTHSFATVSQARRNDELPLTSRLHSQDSLLQPRK